MTEEQTPCPLPKRAQIHGTAATSSLETSERIEGGRTSRRVIRSSALAILATLTIAAPATGFINASQSVVIPVREMGTVAAGVTWVNSVQAPDEVATFEQDLTAASRAQSRAPIEVSACVNSEGAASGVREVTTQGMIYYPVRAGQYRRTSPFSNRIDPFGGGIAFHKGVDYAGPQGTPLYAIDEGVVSIVKMNSSGAGTWVEIDHVDAQGNKYSTVYMHQYPHQILVKQGQTVEAGQQIGGIGNNGWSTGPHLHFEVHDSSGTPVDPEAWLQKNGAVHLGEGCQ